jgi:hypothetical protein
MGKFRLKVGLFGDTHRTPKLDENGKPVLDRNGKPIIKKTHNIYNANVPSRSVVVSASDLVKKFGREKFERLSDDAAIPTAEDDEVVDRDTGDEFSDMSVKQLRDWAETMEVDLGGATTKSKILAILRAQ